MYWFSVGGLGGARRSDCTMSLYIATVHIHRYSHSRRQKHSIGIRFKLGSIQNCERQNPSTPSFVCFILAMSSFLAYVPLQCLLLLPWLHGVLIDFMAISSSVAFGFCLVLLFMTLLLRLCPRVFCIVHGRNIMRYSALQMVWTLGFNAPNHTFG